MPEQDEARALKEFVLLHRALSDARGPVVEKCKLAYQQAFLAVQKNPTDRALLRALDGAQRSLGWALERCGIMGSGAKHRLYRHWEAEALRQLPPDEPVVEVPVGPRGGDGSWVRQHSKNKACAAVQLQGVTHGWVAGCATDKDSAETEPHHGR
jgi:hypothetical protein